VCHHAVAAVAAAIARMTPSPSASTSTTWSNGTGGMRGRGAWPGLPALLRPSNQPRRACCLCRCCSGHPPLHDRGHCWSSSPRSSCGPTLLLLHWQRTCWRWMLNSLSLLESQNECARRRGRGQGKFEHGASMVASSIRY